MPDSMGCHAIDRSIGLLGTRGNPTFSSKLARVLWYDAVTARRPRGSCAYLRIWDWRAKQVASGVFQGESWLQLGIGASDDVVEGQIVHVQAGDVIALPAGTGHSCARSSDDYRYIGVYPSGSPHWRNEYGKHPIVDWATMRTEIESVDLPTADPVTGESDPLLNAWGASPDNTSGVSSA